MLEWHASHVYITSKFYKFVKLQRLFAGPPRVELFLRTSIQTFLRRNAMADKPMWEQIGSGFVQHYYQQFDTDRVKLADLYVSLTRGMDTVIKTAFDWIMLWNHDVWLYFSNSLQTDASCLTWEGEGFQGKTAIMNKLNVSCPL